MELTTVSTSKSAINTLEVLETEKVIVIYPNPSTDNQFYVLLPESKTGEVTTITVYDMNGRTVLTENFLLQDKLIII